VRRNRKLTQAACMKCSHVTAWPEFRCPTCGKRHHDGLRPGRLGLLTRRCECGTHLPTLASRAAWAVAPLCKRCKEPLPQGAGAIRDVRIPVFGDVSAGKTRFLYASLNSLMATARDITFPDDASRSLAEFGLDVIKSGQETAKTSTDAPVSLTCRLGLGRHSELVHMFDAAGELFRATREPGALRFLDEGNGLVYVLDPFSVDGIRKQLGDKSAAALAHAAAGDPELTYDVVVSRLRDSGVPASTQHLAVVVSKADLLRSAGLSLPDGSDAIAGWLREAGVHNLVMAARHEFAEVRFFTVASQDVPPGGPGDPGIPLRWLLAAHGVRLPGGQAGAPRSPNPVPSEPAEARP
jgi:Double-GTPase 2